MQTVNCHVNIHCSLQVIAERKAQMLINKENSNQISESEDEAIGE
jgi:hypothetical protein